MTDLQHAEDAIRILEEHGFDVVEVGVADRTRFGEGEFGLDLQLDASTRRSAGQTSSSDSDDDVVTKSELDDRIEELRRELREDLSAAVKTSHEEV